MILEMHNICKDYPMGKSVSHILKNVDLTVDARDYLAIMGPSGSGKSTLMNLIGCLDVPTSGSYLLDGRDITACNHKQLADIRNKEIGFVFQQYHLPPKLTAEENVALPLLYGGMKKRNAWNWHDRLWKKWVLKISSPTTPSRCPAVSVSVWPLPGPSWANPSCCWQMSPPAHWTVPTVKLLWICFANCTRTVPPLS